MEQLAATCRELLWIASSTSRWLRTRVGEDARGLSTLTRERDARCDGPHHCEQDAELTDVVERGSCTDERVSGDPDGGPAERSPRGRERKRASGDQKDGGQEPCS